MMMEEKDLDEYHSIGSPSNGIVNIPMLMHHGSRTKEHGSMM